MVTRLFSGIHEVRVKTAGAVFAGYFDNEEAALIAVEKLPDYKAAWATLNPLGPDALTADTTINPGALVRSFNVAADEHIALREWLLLDFDPARPTGTNSTNEEKASAYAQAEECRNELTVLGWPLPTVIDSGNGYHLRHRINLPNDAGAHELVRSVLRSLKARYAMLDVTPSNAGRVAKLPDTWARKDAHTEERPHRKSAMLSEGSGTLTAAQLTAIAGDVVAGAEYPTTQEVGSAEAKAARAWLLGYIAHYELVSRTEPRRVLGGWKIGVFCPLTETDAQPHDEGLGETSTIVQIINGKLSFKCSHNTCTQRERKTAAFKSEMAKRNPLPYLPEPGRDAEVVFGGGRLPLLAHATLAEAFLRANHDFCAVYDAPGRPTAQWVKTRWDVSGDDTILWKAVADYLKALHDRYHAPEKGPDSRMRLYDATFINGVVRCVKPYLPPVKAEVFDCEPYMLGLPDCRVIDLRTSAIRDMRREDYISQRNDVSPDPNCPTPRFDRFISEITCGDGALANYLLRLCALCLTADPYQGLFFLWGRGRNGKGVLLRMMTAILGDGRFAWPLRPSEITVSRFGDDASKRTFSQLKGKRLVTVNESVSGNLNLSMLKLMSGGDALSGNRMRQDAVVFKPTHKVLLPTNERPQLPADPAFRGRVHMIPFLANFTGREDRSLDHTLQHVELPGILYRLVTLCPDVIENGLRPPASVLAETDQLFAELDVTKQFRDDCLESEPGTETPAVDMERAVAEWLREQSAAGVTSGHSVVNIYQLNVSISLLLHMLRRWIVRKPVADVADVADVRTANAMKRHRAGIGHSTTY
jgi:P4 family phage/plasmid primase-like protien